MSYSSEQLASDLNLMADLSAVVGENRFKVAAFSRAAEAVAAAGDAAASWPRSAWLETPGIGKGTLALVEEFIARGELAELAQLKKRVPEGVQALLAISGVGPSTAATLWAAGVDSPAKVQMAIADGSIMSVKGFGEKKTNALAKALAAMGAMTGRQRLGRAWPAATAAVAALRAAGHRGELAGETRRGCETVAEALVVSDGDASVSGDVRVIVASSAAFPTTLAHATGPAAHWQALVDLAHARGMTLEPDGLFSAGKRLDLSDELSLYAALGVPWVPPELRDQPLAPPPTDLIAEGDILAELHSHTTASDGSLSLRDMVDAALARGCRVLAITDHSRSSVQANGLSIERLLAQIVEIRALNAALGGRLTLLAGSEVDILSDGSLDYPDAVLAQLDWVVASPHAALNQDSETATARLVRAVAHPAVCVLGHPSGRIIGRRPGLAPDWSVVFAAAAAHGVALEINGNPVRLDLNDMLARQALAAGARLAINTDAHSAADLSLLRYGILTARRAGALRAQVINAWSPAALVAWAHRG